MSTASTASYLPARHPAYIRYCDVYDAREEGGGRLRSLTPQEGAFICNVAAINDRCGEHKRTLARVFGDGPIFRAAAKMAEAQRDRDLTRALEAFDAAIEDAEELARNVGYRHIVINREGAPR